MNAQDVKSALSLFWTRLQADLKFMWANDRVFLFIFGVLIVIAKGSSIMIGLLAAKSKAEVTVASKESAVLKAQEDADNAKADALVKQANDLPSQQKPVADDWYKKKS
jgi:hypothetical protein